MDNHDGLDEALLSAITKPKVRKIRSTTGICEAKIITKGERGRPPEKKKKGSGKWLKQSKVVNDSLSDSDFINRKRVICKEAEEAWKVGKILGLRASCSDEVVISESIRLEEAWDL
ncbi:hypothetical protein PVK06_049060 [Gossypium arboreum]|uniref:Uncharacterized protein n=1 Tax=Gossypium arboreum TaxID=29729 RepID=A0ABR0MHZ3_GOSAR|nr:hypothetical protein PVK06_049060 [Gossypium arboreum]